MKITTRRIGLWVLMAALSLSLGCGSRPSPVTDTSELDEMVTALVLDTLDACRGRLPDIAPAAVVPVSLLKGKPYSRLEEIIVDRLTEKIAQDRDIVALSRENWFELRESQPLSMKGHHPDKARLVNTVTVFMVSVEAEPLMNRIIAGIRVADSSGRLLPGIDERLAFTHHPGAAARVLMNHPALDITAPEGLKENPFNSLETLGYSMVSELRYALERGIRAAGVDAGPKDIQVVLTQGSGAQADPGFTRALMGELQQAVASAAGMDAAVSRGDAGVLFDQEAFYTRNAALFETDHELFRPGPVILMADVRKDPRTAARKVSLRALWRVTPLKDAYGQVVTGNAAGTYVSEFTSRAWFAGPVAQGTALVFSQPRGLGPVPPDKGFD
ncbi:MAG TPA: hypothetical protein DHV36_21575 [Desulfobacteraceae bacterium]|nr:hypothetical protein [Desulfobacteraceae bacterium]